MIRGVVLATAAACGSGTLTRQSQSGAAGGTLVRQVLKNIDEMVFTSTMRVSNQWLDVIMDTGSFEMVLFAKNCRGCTASSAYFDSHYAEDDYQRGPLIATQSYGSGSTTSAESYSNVSITSDTDKNSLTAESQLFWLAESVVMDFALQSSFTGICGLGPPISALAFAKEEAQLTDSFDPNGKESVVLAGVVEVEMKSKPWLANLGVRMFSLCFKQGKGQDGVLVYNENAPETANWLRTTGDFWQVQASDFQIDTIHFNQTCLAVLDSGTSIVGVPENLLREITILVEKYSGTVGCDDLSSWPDFRFKVGSQELSLSASSYVAMYVFGDNELPSMMSDHGKHVERLMPHLKHFRDLHEQRHRRRLEKRMQRGAQEGKELDDAWVEQSAPGYCAPALFAMDPGATCEFLIGIPFFREYHTTHRLSEDGMSADSVLFTRPGAECSMDTDVSLQATRPKHTAPLRINPEKIRFPKRAVQRRARKEQ